MTPKKIREAVEDGLTYAKAPDWLIDQAAAAELEGMAEECQVEEAFDLITGHDYSEKILPLIVGFVKQRADRHKHPHAYMSAASSLAEAIASSLVVGMDDRLEEKFAAAEAEHSGHQPKPPMGDAEFYRFTGAKAEVGR